jgi:hypothetical protein
MRKTSPVRKTKLLQHHKHAGSGLTWNTISSMTVDQGKQEYEEKINTNCVKRKCPRKASWYEEILEVCVGTNKGCKKQWHFDFQLFN